MLRTLSICFCLLFFGCDAAHPSRAPVQAFLDAVLYGDVERLYVGHVESTSQSEWCRPEFKSALNKARDEADSEDCQRVRSLKQSDLEGMRDELRLAVQITGWTCQHPEGTCVEYARTVFEQAVETHPLIVTKPKSAVIRNIFGDESTAAAYVDIVNADGSTEHRTLELRKVGEGWRVTKGFLTL